MDSENSDAGGFDSASEDEIMQNFSFAERSSIQCQYCQISLIRNRDSGTLYCSKCGWSQEDMITMGEMETSAGTRGRKIGKRKAKAPEPTTESDDEQRPKKPFIDCLFLILREQAEKIASLGYTFDLSVILSTFWSDILKLGMYIRRRTNIVYIPEDVKNYKTIGLEPWHTIIFMYIICLKARITMYFGEFIGLFVNDMIPYREIAFIDFNVKCSELESFQNFFRSINMPDHATLTNEFYKISILLSVELPPYHLKSWLTHTYRKHLHFSNIGNFSAKIMVENTIGLMKLMDIEAKRCNSCMYESDKMSWQYPNYSKKKQLDFVNPEFLLGYVILMMCLTFGLHEGESNHPYAKELLKMLILYLKEHQDEPDFISFDIKASEYSKKIQQDENEENEENVVTYKPNGLMNNAFSEVNSTLEDLFPSSDEVKFSLPIHEINKMTQKHVSRFIVYDEKKYDDCPLTFRFFLEYLANSVGMDHEDLWDSYCKMQTLFLSKSTGKDSTFSLPLLFTSD